MIKLKVLTFSITPYKIKPYDLSTMLGVMEIGVEP